MFLARKRLNRCSAGDNGRQSGLTLIESLVAIAVIGITVAVASPVVVLSVGTRIQNQRAEQAWRLAQAEIDRIRTLVERGGDYSTEIAAYPVTTSASIEGTVAPTVFSATTTEETVAREIDVNGDGEFDFAVQVFRTTGASAGTPPVPIAFEIGARVYDHRAAQTTLDDGGALETGEASLGFNNSLFGDRDTKPLAEVYTEVLQGDREGAFCDYWTYLSAAASTAGLNCS